MNRTAVLERIEKCQQILGTNPESQIFAALAEAYRKLGDLKAALDTCNDGLKRHPDYGSAYLVLAKIARDQKRYADAELAAQRAIELEGRTRSAEILLSDIYLQVGKFQQAESILTRLAKADPSNVSVKRLLDLVHKASRAAELQGSGSVKVPVAASSAKPKPIPAPEPPTRSIPTAPEIATASMPTGTVPPARPHDAQTPGDEPWHAAFEALDHFPHLRGRLAVGYDGLLLHTDIAVRSEAEGAAAMSAELFGSVRTEWPEETYGALDQVMIETGQSVWWIWPFAEHLLVLWCDPNVNMGPLRLRLTQLEGYLLTSTYGGSR